MESRLVLVASSLGCQCVMQAKILVDWNEIASLYEQNHRDPLFLKVLTIMAQAKLY